MNKNYMIVTGRFQPLHVGHISLFRSLLKEYEENLVICILKTPNRQILASSQDRNSSRYYNLSALTRSAERNPLPNWQRLRLLSIAISQDELLSDKTTILLRERPDLYWEKSIMDLPENRIWVINPVNSEFDEAKIAFYKQKNEKVRIIKRSPEINGEVIRENLQRESPDFGFLPESCTEFFVTECLEYFINKRR